MATLTTPTRRLTKSEQEARIKPIITQAYRRMLSGTVAEAAALAYTPSGPPVEELERRIQDYRDKINH